MLFNKKHDAFLNYAIEGKKLDRLGDPVGHEKDKEDLVTRFRDLCRIKNAMPVFYQVDQDHFQFYLNLGLTLLKISEEAQVDLSSFQPANVSADLKTHSSDLKKRKIINLMLFRLKVSRPILKS